jgi:hypothetical protein
MKQVKKAYEEYKAKFSNRPPNEIDFGLGFNSALIWLKEKIDCGAKLNDIESAITKERQ